ncbi:hypothetical protein TNIN_118491 [Trichonephila inaurata madagascariensis]|uniref:Uncharacterized protein n=1 Tax=Trichonephila inaurata madagascariensis TaxID=2747483 RepID=A0A8X6XDW7_9ARAC|nr:hypothetical protein TNIN_118491 [Trichonephila inaurata madagascariensis]
MVRALDDLLQFLDVTFQADQSILPVSLIPNSGNAEFCWENTADEILFEEAAPGWKVGTTSDIRFAMDSRNNNYVPEGTGSQYGSLPSSQIDLFDSKRKPSFSLLKKFY